MKKTIFLLMTIALSVIGTYKAGAECLYYAASNDSAGISKDSLERMTKEDFLAYCDSIYKDTHPWIKEVVYDESERTSQSPNRQKQNFSYTNSYVPDNVTVNTSKAVGQIDIQSGLSPTGAKTYTVPINSYRQEGAFCPEISLNYNSQGGKGAFGKGWSIGGIQTISRGNKSVYYDGKTGGIEMDTDDAFYLDGVRLIRTSTTAYEYETEVGQIKAVATVDGTVVKYFNVYYPSGYTAVFGMTSTTANQLDYPITTLTNEKGQSITYYYSLTGGYYRLYGIYYSPSASILLSYSYTSNDLQYKGGLTLNNNYLLQDIKTYVGGNITGTYSLSYIEDNGVSLLSQIDYTANGSSLNPLIFYYGDNTAEQDYYTDSGFLTNGYSYENRNALTATRGRFDYLSGSEGILFYPYKNHYYHITRNSGLFNENYLYNLYSSNDHIHLYEMISGNGSVNMATTLNTGSDFITMITANLDGNQQECIIKVNNCVDSNLDKVTFTVYQKTSYALVQKYTPRTYSYSTVYTDNDGNKSVLPKYYFPGDFDGDGKMEILVITAADPFETGSGNSMCNIYDLNNNISLYSGSPFNYVRFLEGNHRSSIDAENLSDKLIPYDYNGDGKTDLCHIHSNGISIYSFYQNNGIWSAQVVNTSSELSKSTLEDRYWSVGDFNGDGLADIIYSSKRGALGNSYWNFLYSMGNGTFQHTNYVLGPNMANSTSDFLVQDVNGDGISDLVELTNNDFTAYTMNKGVLTQEATQDLSSTGEFLTPVELFSSSLSTQFISLLGTSATLYSYKTNLRTDQALTGMANSNGIIEKNYYYTISQDNTSIYSKGYNASFPYVNIYEPITVLAGNEIFAGGVSKDENKYYYSNAVVHRQGLSFRGFEYVNTLNKRGQTSSYKYDPFKFSLLVQVLTPVSNIINTYWTTSSSYKIRKSLLTSKEETDLLHNFTATTTYTYDIYGHVQTENSTYPGNIAVNRAYTYTNFTNVNSKYRLGRLYSSTVTTIRGNSQHSEETLFSSYNNSDQPLTIINKVNGNTVKTINMEYDSRGNMTKQSVTPFSAQTPRISTFQYDIYDHLTRSVDPLGVWKNYTYNTDGTISKITSYIGETNYTYDAFGRQIKETLPDGTELNTAFTWNTENGGLYAVTKTGSAIPTSTTIYDALNREVRSKEARFNNTQLLVDKGYDDYGNLTSESLPYKGTSPIYNTYVYDTYNRLTEKSEPSGKTTTYTYSGLSTTVSDGTMYTIKTMDALGEVVSVTDPAGTITYTLNGAGSPTSITTPADDGTISTSITYDSYGRRTQIADPSYGTTIYSYGSDGHLASETNANNKTITYTYDNYDRMTSKGTTEFTTTYSYNDNLNALASVTSSNGTSTTYNFDTYGRMASVRENAVDSKWLQKNFTYANGRVSAIQYTSQSGTLGTENFTYAYGHLTEVKLNNTTSIFKLNNENQMGLTTQATTGNLTRNYGYNAYGMQTGRVIVQGSTTRSVVNYTYNTATGNLTSRYHPLKSKTENFTYDNLYRLTNYAGTAVTYDDNGNILSKGDIGSFSYGTTGKPFAVSEVTLNNSISAATQVANYTSFDRPSSVYDGAYSVSFTYNGDYDRVRMIKTQSGQTQLTRYYLGGCYELDVKSSGSIEKLYLNGDYYTAPAVLIKQGTSSSVYNIIRDHLGSITHVMNASGTQMQELSYDAWGRLRNPSTFALYDPASEPEPYLGRGYCGHEHLTGIGLINMNARLYDPLLGRFLASDPYVQAPDMTQNFNRYSYCLNNPLRYYDKSGKFFLTSLIAGFIKGATELVSGQGYWYSPFYRAYKNTINDVKIDIGLFKGGLTKVLSRLTWELPQTSIGLSYSYLNLMVHDVDKVRYYDGATYVINKTNKTEGTTGSTLGSYINITTIEPIPMVDNEFAPYAHSVYAHEYGHYLQSQSSGLAYLFKYGIPSVIDFLKNKDIKAHYQDRNGEMKELEEHHVINVEIDANRRAAQYFSNKSVLNYSINYGWDYESTNPTYAVVLWLEKK